MIDFRKHENADGDPCIVASTLTAEEMSMAVALIDDADISRNGYMFECRGSCAKFAQGLWFDIEIEFEDANDRDAIMEMYLAHPGWPDADGSGPKP